MFSERVGSLGVPNWNPKGLEKSLQYYLKEGLARINFRKPLTFLRKGLGRATRNCSTSEKRNAVLSYQRKENSTCELGRNL